MRVYPYWHCCIFCFVLFLWTTWGCVVHDLLFNSVEHFVRSAKYQILYRKSLIIISSNNNLKCHSGITVLWAQAVCLFYYVLVTTNAVKAKQQIQCIFHFQRNICMKHQHSHKIRNCKAIHTICSNQSIWKLIHLMNTFKNIAHVMECKLFWIYFRQHRRCWLIEGCNICQALFVHDGFSLHTCLHL